MNDADITRKAVEALKDVLQVVSFAELVEDRTEHNSSENRVDWQGRLRLPVREILLLLEVKNIGEPRIARNAVNQLLRYQAGLPDSYGVFAAPGFRRQLPSYARKRASVI